MGSNPKLGNRSVRGKRERGQQRLSRCHRDVKKSRRVKRRGEKTGDLGVNIGIRKREGGGKKKKGIRGGSALNTNRRTIHQRRSRVGGGSKVQIT